MKEIRCPFRKINDGRLVCHIGKEITPITECSFNCMVLANLPLCKHAELSRYIMARDEFGFASPVVRIGCKKFIKNIKFEDCQRCEYYDKSHVDRIR